MKHPVMLGCTLSKSSLDRTGTNLMTLTETIKTRFLSLDFGVSLSNRHVAEHGALELKVLSRTQLT